MPVFEKNIMSLNMLKRKRKHQHNRTACRWGYMHASDSNIFSTVDCIPETNKIQITLCYRVSVPSNSLKDANFNLIYFLITKFLLSKKTDIRFLKA